jgi:hypothetical protein
MKTVLQELIEEFESIKENKCKTLQEIIFFDGVLAIIESKYLEKEKNQIIASYNQDLYGGIEGNRKFEDGAEYFEEIFNKIYL